MQEKKSKTSGQELTQSSPTEQRNILEEVAEKLLSEEERAALASVPGNLPFAAKLVAAQKPAVKSVVVLKKELSGCDPDFLSGIHNQLATLSITKHGDASGFAFVRSVLKEANPANHLEMLLFTQLLAVHDAMMTSSKLLGEAKTIEEVNSHGNNLNKFARTFAALLETLHRCRSGPEPKLTVQNLSVRDGGQAIVGNVTHSAEAAVQLTPRRPRFLKAISRSKRCQTFSRRNSQLRPCRVLCRTKSLLQARQKASDAHDKRSQAQRRTHAFEHTLRCADPLGRIL